MTSSLLISLIYWQQLRLLDDPIDRVGCRTPARNQSSMPHELLKKDFEAKPAKPANATEFGTYLQVATSEMGDPLGGYSVCCSKCDFTDVLEGLKRELKPISDGIRF